MSRVIDFVKSLEEAYDFEAEAPKRLRTEVYYIIRQHSVHEAIDFVKSLSKDLIGEELTDQEVISAMSYMEISRFLDSLVSPILHMEFSPYLYMVQGESDGKIWIKDEKDIEGLESLFSQLQEEQVDQAYIYIALKEGDLVKGVAFVSDFNEALNAVKQYVKAVKGRETKIGCEFITYKGFNTIENVFDYVESYPEQTFPERTFLIFHKHAKGTSLILHKNAKNVRMIKTIEDYFGVYILYERKGRKGWANDPPYLLVDKLEIEANLNWLKSFFDTYGKQAVMEYIEYLFKSEEYLPSAINFLGEGLKKEMTIRDTDPLQVMIYIDKGGNLDSEFVIDGYDNYELDFMYPGIDLVRKGFEEYLRQARLIPNDFLSFNAAMRNFPYIGL